MGGGISNHLVVERSPIAEFTEGALVAKGIHVSQAEEEVVVGNSRCLYCAIHGLARRTNYGRFMDDASIRH